MIFTVWVCYIKVGAKPRKFFKYSLFSRFYALVKFLILQFTTIPLVGLYLQIEQNDKSLHVYVHRVRYEQFPNLID